jgi:hypothetical protein
MRLCVSPSSIPIPFPSLTLCADAARLIPMCTHIPIRATKARMASASVACVILKATSWKLNSNQLNALLQDRFRRHYPSPYLSLSAPLRPILFMLSRSPYGLQQTPAYLESLSIPHPPIKCTALRDCAIHPLPAIDTRIVVLEGQRRTLPGLTPEEREHLASPTGAGLPSESVSWIRRMLPLQQVCQLRPCLFWLPVSLVNRRCRDLLYRSIQSLWLSSRATQRAFQPAPHLEPKHARIMRPNMSRKTGASFLHCSCHDSLICCPYSSSLSATP